jgi:hypothetical protein
VGEFVNIAVLSYDTDKDKPEVYLGFVEDWVSVNNAVGEPYDPVFENLLGAFLGKINTKKALQNSIENSQDSVFLFGDPQDSSTPANLLAEEIAETLHC